LPEYDVAERMEQVLGHPPRLEPLAQHEIDERARGVITRLRQATNYPEEAEIHPFFATMCRQPEFFETFMTMGVNVVSSTQLPPRDREIVILRTGWLCGAPYQWGEHVKTAKELGITSEEIEKVTEGSTAEGWTRHEAALLRAVEELHRDAILSDRTWNELAEQLDSRQLIEVLMISGHYHSMAYVQNTLRFRTNPYNTGLSAR